MFRHMAMWKFNDESTPGLNRENAIKIKAGLEELVYEVHGLISADVHIDVVKTPTGNADILMESLFESRDAFRKYLDHPRRKAMLELIEDCTEEYLCMDFEDEEEEETGVI